MDPRFEQHRQMTRRQLFGRSATGIGTAALATLLGRDLAKAAGLPQPTSPGGAGAGSGPGSAPHFAPKAKRVIYLMQGGAPTQVDLFDYKPQLEKMRGKQLPDSVRQGQ